jgi:prolyl oligopeptidase
LIYDDPDNPERMFGAHVTFDGEWVRLTISASTDPVNKVWLARLDKKSLPKGGRKLLLVYANHKGQLEWMKIKDDFDSGLYYIANNGPVFYFESNLNAPKGKVVRYDVGQPVTSPIPSL